ncbi:MAG TPA: hypothetical protein VM431_10120 [Phycisphaerae bacterium]|nr:hypothetical protein [Phycisphaerae bacterium]
MPTWLLPIAEVFEAGMLVCFGFAWPLDILRTLRTRRVEGKSVGFMSLILLGYVCGMAAKVIRAGGDWPELVTALYAFNALMIAIDIALVLRFRARAR